MAIKAQKIVIFDIRMFGKFQNENPKFLFKTLLLTDKK